uniref:Uncharacterized protein n=1 Tax=viral metagenome TaxID=1070528 RepID=A0A6M3K7A7_9ZZZZ
MSEKVLDVSREVLVAVVTRNKEGAPSRREAERIVDAMLAKLEVREVEQVGTVYSSEFNVALKTGDGRYDVMPVLKGTELAKLKPRKEVV